MNIFSLSPIKTISRKKMTEFNLEISLEAALDWIMTAHQATACQGVSKGFDIIRQRWSPPYPETTGYTIPTLLNAATLFNHGDLFDLARKLADFELNQITPEGGVQHWDKQNYSSPCVFDTGQVIFGWLSSYQNCRDERFLQAAEKAGDWLVSIQDFSGSWAQGQHLNVVKVIDTRVSWALLELARFIPKEIYRTAAVRNLEWAITQQNSDGWFKNCAFNVNASPFTHTLAYTAEGLLESGIILNGKRYIAAAKLTTDALRERLKKDGSLSGSFKAGWKSSSNTTCLTGSCQLARLWLRFFELERQPEDYNAAIKAITFVAATQVVKTRDVNIRGGISGSYPLYGSYERFKYPNWATKFFIDALLTLQLFQAQGTTKLEYGG